MAADPPGMNQDRPRVRAPRNFLSGLALIALAAIAVFGTRNMDQGSLHYMGPAMFPRWVAVLIGLCGLLLIALSFVRDGKPLAHMSLRGPVMVGAAIVLFGLTIRTLGLAIAGPISLVLASYATPEARLRSTVVLALAITAFCVLLFRYLLDLSLPILIIPGTSLKI